MKVVRVDLGDRSYDIRTGCGVPVGRWFEGRAPQKVLLISDSNVDPLYGDAVSADLSAAGAEVARMVIPAGEESKSLTNVSCIYDRMLECGMDRNAVVAALGGGVIGDLSGFAAATFLRGVKFLQIPTSLLAMVDSSVGGKTGVNVPQGKNLVGAFYQPVEVVADIETLRTLEDREYLSGLAEVIKYGIIWDAEFFKLLEDNSERLVARDSDILETVVARCCEIKADVVSRDEKESGLRAILNFGHTLGHAIENVAGYGELLHGEAVAIGMVYASRLSEKLQGLSLEDVERIKALTAACSLPVDCTALKGRLAWSDLRSAMSVDKKTQAGVLKFVLARSMGSVEIGCEVSDDLLEDVFNTF